MSGQYTAMANNLHDQKKHHTRGGRNDGIVRGYSHLATSDIKMLTKILSHAPKQRNSTMAASYERIVNEQSSKLPTHLRTKLPWVSTFCSIHNKISPWPVNSILEWIKDEVDNCVPAVWAPVRRQKLLSEEQSRMLSQIEELSVLWTPSDDSKQAKGSHSKGRVSYGYGSAKCGGCILAQIGGNLELLVALGGFFIGRVDQSIWKRSKRILWIESWIRDAADNDEADLYVQEMWQLEMEMRELRKNGSAKDRAYVDEYIEKANAGEQRRSQKQPSRERPIESEDPADAWLNEVTTADELFDNKDEWDQLQPSEPSEWDPTITGGYDPVQDFEADFDAGHLFRPSSSVYSQRSGRSRASSHGSMSRLLDLYRHSAYTQDGRPF